MNRSFCPFKRVQIGLTGVCNEFSARFRFGRDSRGHTKIHCSTAFLVEKSTFSQKFFQLSQLSTRTGCIQKMFKKPLTIRAKAVLPKIVKLKGFEHGADSFS
jgi:hypothetical protein